MSFVNTARTLSGRAASSHSLPPMVRGLLKRAGRDWRGRSLLLHLPSGESMTIVGSLAGPEAVLTVHSFEFLRRVMAAGDIGFAEGYVAGEWDTPDLAGLLDVLCENWERLNRLATGSPLVRLSNLLLNQFRRNSRTGAKRNIEAHYDLGNAFYGAWLDQSMTYSSALYGATDEPLEIAQRRKYAALARAIGLRPEHSVLEVGCGWGGFAEFAATEIGCHVTGLTISPAQHAFARQRMASQGLDDRVDIRLQDYREVEGAYDRVVSIEMFEAVGEAYWPTYFDVVRERLKPGGRAGLQIISIRDDLFESYRKRVDFIQKYVFPGGMLPGERRLRTETGRAGLTWSHVRRFGADYGRTLAEWAARFEAAWPALRDQGFDDRFRRLWRFYLAYCEAGFRTGRTDVLQLVLER